ncbi:Signal-transducing histidine kinase protein [Halorhabdus tiamatea SARL4B]|uniref:histidine kinase n=1 Tax=Halorhabdus tiamatea SARL4B TaxID=1033806 RepID=F7PKN4_9EURY|nr:PAS domain S-box protein [Halorhabdus tiamatea]ERJ05947.1 Signal-transducing histidine kinase protein [Halorhabdus tiamatea SARL4B]CCQ34019.1 multi-sensor signal transduction histidine kinase [Halorhabdus tiamatea SARL4B]
MAVERPDEIRVLHVDDEPDLAAVTGEYLQREDDRITVGTAASASEGLDELAEETVDCVVSDYDMPGQDGIEFLETVREEYPDLPFILYTGKGSEAVASDAIGAGVTDYLQKESGADHYRLLANRIVNAVERYRAGERVERAERRYRTLFEEMNEGAALHQLVYEGGEPVGYEILEVNGNFETVLDISAEAAIGRRAIDVYDVEEPPYFDRYVQVAETGESMEFETHFEPLGKHFHVSVFSPQTGQFATVFSDVSEENAVEARLCRERALYNAQSEATLDGHLVVDDDRTIVSYNSRLLELWDIPENLIESRDDEAVLDHVVEKTADPDEFRTLVESLYDQPNAESRDEIELTDGRWFDRYSTPVVGADGTRYGRLWVFRDISDRKARERELSRLSERLELAVEGANLGVWDWDMTTDDVEFNEQWAAMLGHSTEEIEPHLDAWERRVHPDDLPVVEAALEAHIEDETPLYDTEHRMKTADGDWKWIRDIGRVVERDENGEPRRAVGIHLDIDDRKQREQQLRLFRQAVEQTAHAVYITDVDGTIEYVNPAFEPVTGYTETEALGNDPSILNSGEYDETFYEDLWETITDGQRWRAEMIDRDADGDRIVLEQSIAPITDADGDPTKFVAVAQDVTQRKEAERELERARAQLRQVIDLVPDLLFAKDRDGRFLLANETTADAYGLSSAEVEGKLESAIIPDVEDAEQFREDDLAVIESGEPMVVPEEELTTADGETRILETTKIPYEVQGSGEDAVLGYARDITELMEYERELEAQRDNLEVLNQVVRHDIRNELQLVVAYADLLRRDADGTESDYAETVLEAARGAVDIIETARDVTEIMLQSDADPTPVDLPTVLLEAVEDLRSRYERAVVTVKEPLPDVEVLADDMLASVFRNLLTNAVKHNDSDVPEVTVTARAEGHVTVSVADNGPGIPEERRDAIFDQGETGLDSTGTGLGLYLVETLVDRYGGTVTVEDNDPTGSVFVVTLPVAE